MHIGEDLRDVLLDGRDLHMFAGSLLTIQEMGALIVTRNVGLRESLVSTSSFSARSDGLVVRCVLGRRYL